MIIAVITALLFLWRLLPRLRSLRGLAFTPSLSRHLSHWVKAVDYSKEELFAADDAAARWVDVRRQAFDALAAELDHKSPRSAEWGTKIRRHLSDLRFADANRVPFPFGRLMRESFNLSTVAVASDGPYLTDLDGERWLDVGGSYGVNVAGYERYKNWMEAGWQRVKDLGPVLGPLHPIVLDNCERLKRIAGLDEVSFHASGTEAVMAAVRLVRFNTRRRLIVTFSGAYHGWWDGVQPGIGSERDIGDVLTLKEMDRSSLAAIRARAHEIAGVLVNPVQSFHPNSPPPNDAVLLTSEIRKTHGQSSAYASWLRELREVCSNAGVPLVFDEIYSGFRLARGGAQEYFGVRADMVLYGKTVAGGMPIGIVCGKTELMHRFDSDHPMRIAYVVGTFSAHPLVMGAMSEFLRWLDTPKAALLYEAADANAAQWVTETNTALAAACAPVEVTHLGTIWTVVFKRPSRFNWLMQYYLRAEGVCMSWVGTGRCLFSMDFAELDYASLRTKLVRAATRMRDDKWWLSDAEQPDAAHAVRARLTMDLVKSVLQPPRPVQAFYREVMRRKHDDHVASHSNRINQVMHFVSSSVFIVCYVLMFFDLVTAMCLGLGALFLRQTGHALIEPPCHDKEQLLLGFDTHSKTWIVAGYALIPLVNVVANAFATEASGWLPIVVTVAKQWFVYTGVVVFGRVLLLIRRHGLRNALIWFVKLVTDPFTDLPAYYRSFWVARPT
jgi:glutamate-1-semialdehyde 2,1-aminomutase